MQKYNVFIFVLFASVMVSSAFSMDTQEILEQSSLAVLITYQPKEKGLAEALQSLLEAEVSMQWAGHLVESNKGVRHLY